MTSVAFPPVVDTLFDRTQAIDHAADQERVKRKSGAVRRAPWSESALNAHALFEPLRPR